MRHLGSHTEAARESAAVSGLARRVLPFAGRRVREFATGLPPPVQIDYPESAVQRSARKETASSLAAGAWPTGRREKESTASAKEPALT